MSRVYRPRNVRFRVVCGAHDTQVLKRVTHLLWARSIVPEVCEVKRLCEVYAEVDIHIRETLGVQAIRLARIYQDLAGVHAVQLEVDGEQVDFREKLPANPGD